MLRELRIRDFAIIDELELVFDSGLVVFTGETGAGKSIIIDAVELLLGSRAESSGIRTGAEAAIVEGSFRLSDDRMDDINAILRPEGLLDDPRYLTLGREIRREGRNICRVNGRTVSLGLLRELGELLVDVHGQSEHLSLLRVKEHLRLLDRYAGTEGLRESFQAVFVEFGRVKRELSELRRLEQEAEARTDLLNYQVNEIEAAALQPGEAPDLQDELVRLANAEKLTALVQKAISAIDEGERAEHSTVELMGRAVESLDGLARVDPSLEPLRLEGQALMEQITELAGSLRVYREQIEFNPRRLDEVEERLALIRSLERKYGGSIEAVLAHAEHAGQELEKISHAEDRIQELEAEQEHLLTQLGEAGLELSNARREAAGRLAQAIEEQLADLRMEQADFDTNFLWKDDPGGVRIGDRNVAITASGLDWAEFQVEANPGEGLKPLVKIASGGESSRLMLGLKSVLAQADRVSTLIFDEIDQGIGGRVGAIVGRKLWALTEAHQVLCVTHLPQLAAYGDQHFRVEKQVKAGRTVTLARPLTSKEHPEELAQMLGGLSDANLQSAADLLDEAAQVKASLAPTRVQA